MVFVCSNIGFLLNIMVFVCNNIAFLLNIMVFFKETLETSHK